MISLRDVKGRPQDFDIMVQENPMNLSIVVMIRDRHYKESQHITINEQDPLAAIITALLIKSEALPITKMSTDTAEKLKRIESLSDEVDDLDAQIKKLQSEPNEVAPQEEYAYVEGWDDF